MRNEEICNGVNKERNIVYAMKRRKANWAGHILRRNCLLKHVVEGKIERKRGRRRRKQLLNDCPLKHVVEEKVEGRRRGRKRSKQLLDGVKEKRGYWNFEEEELDRTLWRTGFGRGYGSVLKQTTH
jgi:hypothetical protein